MGRVSLWLRRRDNEPTKPVALSSARAKPVALSSARAALQRQLAELQATRSKIDALNKSVTDPVRAAETELASCRALLDDLERREHAGLQAWIAAGDGAIMPTPLDAEREDA